jgi:hypothetical protein
MYRIDEFIKYYKELEKDNTQCSFDGKTWGSAKPISYPYSIIEKQYWKVILNRIKDSFHVLMGNADAVTWKNLK